MNEHRTSNWKQIDETLRRLARDKGKYDLEEGRWLLAGLRSGVHLRLGFATFAEYVERLFGYKPRFTAERLRVAEALQDLPVASAALEGGDVCWSAVREVSRVATPETEAAWLAAADGKTVRQVEDLVSGHRPGDRPDDPIDSGARRHVLRFEVSAEAFAEFREARAKVERDAGHSLDDDEALRLIARQVLGGPTDEGRAAYQICLSVCEQCGRGYEQGAGELIEVAPEVIEMAECDAQQIGRTHVGHEADEMARGDAKRIDRTHVGGKTCATQAIPPAIRRQIVRREHGQCAVPGCRCSRYLDIHHLRPRADGGKHDPANLLLLCAAHHAAIHRGFLIVEGRAPDRLRFLHADGTDYGAPISAPAVAERSADAFQALKQLGFTETQARRCLSAALTHLGADATLESLVRAALAETRREAKAA